MKRNVKEDREIIEWNWTFVYSIFGICVVFSAVLLELDPATEVSIKLVDQEIANFNKRCCIPIDLCVLLLFL